MEAIILCGLPASGKTTVAKIIAKKFHWKVMGGTEILKEMAKKKGYKMSGDDWWDTPHGIKFLKERKTNPNFDKETDRIMLKLIKKGNVVMTSYTAPWLSKTGFKCWLSAPLNERAARMAKRDSTHVKESIKATRIRDKENQALYRKLYHIRFGKDFKPFDMVIDTGKISARKVASMIINAYIAHE
ncbi:MAG: cytidylate kinase family protein [Candidatus Micrarchaeota archaeon]|nr:cytidylate kinase family protein [Candidatus Micrarchaeota archaeon]